MSAISQSVDSLLRNTAPYSVSSGLYYGENGDIAGIGNATYTGDMSGDIWKPTNQLGKESFLLLLTTQLKYQDPLSPMENTEFVSQLAQFRELEAAENTEKAMRELQESFQLTLDTQMYAAQSFANSSAMSLIGKEVRMRQVAVSYDGKADTQVPIRVHLGNAESGVVEIRNADGEVIKTITAAGKDAENSVTVYWDGTMDNGQKAKAGNYLVDVQGSENNPALYPFVQSLVEGVRFTADGVLVKIDGREISIGEVLDVSTGESAFFNQSSALSMMGKLVQARFDTIHHNSKEDGVYDYGLFVNGPANQQVNVEIKNSKGEVVKTLRGHTDDAGRAQLFWDGLTTEGDNCPSGEYKLHLVGSDKNPRMYTYLEGLVDGLTSLTGDFKLKVGAAEIPVSDIISITTPKT